MYRTHTCGELRLANVNETVCLSGWVQKIRNLGAMTFIDLRDRYGITQLVVEESATEEIRQQVAALGREFVIQVTGKVVERSSKNNKIPTGEIEILIAGINVLSRSEIPPFTIEEHTDGGDELRMKYRYLDLRRAVVRKNLELRHRMAHLVRNYLDSYHFMENPRADKEHAGGSTRFCGAFPHESGTVLCLAAESADLQAIVDGSRI